MRTNAECLSCLAAQASAAAGISSNNQATAQRVADAVERLLPELDQSLSPPENAVAVYGLVAGITGVADPYRHLRRQSNRMALGLREEILKRVRRSGNPFATALRYAVAANVIDYGAPHTFDALAVLDGCLQREAPLDETAGLTADVQEPACRKVLYLADNAGELVFDGMVAEMLQEEFGCDVTMAVRGKPILNDATQEDVAQCGTDKICRVITTGSGCPGIPLSSCSEEFRNAYHASDMIISKGQGNFETLSDRQEKPMYFLLTVKCPVVGRQVADMRRTDAETKIASGDLIVMKRSG